MSEIYERPKNRLINRDDFQKIVRKLLILRVNFLYMEFNVSDKIYEIWLLKINNENSRK